LSDVLNQLEEKKSSVFRYVVLIRTSFAIESVSRGTLAVKVTGKAVSPKVGIRISKKKKRFISDDSAKKRKAVHHAEASNTQCIRTPFPADLSCRAAKRKSFRPRSKMKRTILRTFNQSNNSSKFDAFFSSKSNLVFFYLLL